jgi:phosphatidylglycerol---prolipoprotein diacylglyceryl transferase
MFGPYVHQIDPILFSIAGVHLWWYGLGFALGFLEIHLWLRRGHGRLHLSLREVWSLSLFTAVGVLVGGRAVEVAFDEWPFYRAHLSLIPAFWLGGMATHGLLFGGVVGAALFARLYRKPFLLLADALVIPAAFLMGIGRLGNFIDGQIVGAVTDVSWAVKFPDADGFRHPVVLYDGAKNLVLMAYLLHVRRVNTTPGATAARFVFWYAFPRVFIDLFRDYPTHRLALGTGQTLNIVMALLGAALLYRSRLRRLGRLKSRLVTPFPGGSLDVAPLASQRIAFVCLLAFCLTIPSNWTQDIPSRYGGRHPGLEYSWLYPRIDTAPPPLPAEIAAPGQSRGRPEVGVTRWWPSRAVQRSKRLGRSAVPGRSPRVRDLS